MNIVLPAVLKGKGNTTDDTGGVKRGTKNKSSNATTTESTSKKKKATEASKGATGSTDHDNPERVTEWCLPTGMNFNEIFKSGAKNWPSFLDKRIPTKSNKTQIAPMCVRFQAMGTCKRVCQLAHAKASNMTSLEREKVERLFKNGLRTVTRKAIGPRARWPHKTPPTHTCSTLSPHAPPDEFNGRERQGREGQQRRGSENGG